MLLFMVMQGNVKDICEARDRRTDVLAAVKENDKERTKFKAEIAENEADRRSIQVGEGWRAKGMKRSWVVEVQQKLPLFISRRTH